MISPGHRLEALALLILASGNGCVCAHRVVEEPELDVKVTSGAAPLPSAEVHYFHWSYPHRRLHGDAVATTDPSGNATFAGRAKTEAIYPLCMHGIPSHNVSVCVSKPGYAPVIFEIADPSEPTAVTVELRPDPAPVTCDWDDVERQAGGTPRPDISANVRGGAELGGPKADAGAPPADGGS